MRGDSAKIYDIADCANRLVEIARQLNQDVSAWDSHKIPILNEDGD